MVATENNPPKSNSKGELIFTIILSLLQWVLTMNPWLACSIWVLIGGLSGHLVWKSQWTKEWPETAKIVSCLAIAAIISWQALGVLKNDKPQMTISPIPIKVHAVRLAPFQEGQPIRFIIFYDNKNETSGEFYSCFGVRRSPLLKPMQMIETKDRIDFEGKFWKERISDPCINLLSGDHQTIPPGSDNHIEQSLGPSLTADIINSFQTRTFYFGGILIYENNRKITATTEFCMAFFPDGAALSCIKHNGPL